jgi:hypothetical protein
MPCDLHEEYFAMPRLPSIILVAALAASTPAVAQPLHITVPGGSELSDPTLQRHYIFGFDNDPDARAILWNDYLTPDRFGGPFNGARAAMDAESIAHPKVRFRQQWNYDTAATLSRTGDSFSEHWLKCQRAFASYDLVTDTYTGAGGLPRPCRL